MEKFWEWMLRNGYAEEPFFDKDKEYGYTIPDLNEHTPYFFDEHRQLLIGYMMEFLLEKGIKAEVILDDEFDNSVDDVYKYLEKRINGGF